MKGLGDRIHAIRKSRKLTLVELAKTTSIDQATLSRIENGKMTGTLDSHMRIADALGVRLPDLYNEVIEKTYEAKEKAAKQKLETFSHSTGAIAELLTSGILQKKMMPLLLKIKPGGNTETEEYEAPSERFIYVVKGSIEAIFDKDSRVLSAGESLYFNSSARHYFKNSAKIEACLLSVLTPASL
jgi:transcriptional regulator with XRE-family HTH domain